MNIVISRLEETSTNTLMLVSESLKVKKSEKKKGYIFFVKQEKIPYIVKLILKSKKNILFCRGLLEAHKENYIEMEKSQKVLNDHNHLFIPHNKKNQDEEINYLVNNFLKRLSLEIVQKE